MSSLTPMMQQYMKIKDEYKYCLVFFRLGDFYELFFDDAIIASKELDIVLTGRDCGQAERAPMCGVPYHSAEGYIARLVEKGHKVAICEQMENPKDTKNIVKRDVVRIITPGTVIDGNSLDSTKNNYIMSIFADKNGYGVAFADVSTGEFVCSSLGLNEEMKIIDEISKFSPSEIICNTHIVNKSTIENMMSYKINIYEEWAYNFDNANKKLCDHFRVLNLDGFGISNRDKHCVSSAGALLQYLYDTQKNALTHITHLKLSDKYDFMGLDTSSRRNLELTETIREKTKKGSLLWVLDKTKTSMGARLLRKWVEQPLVNTKEINNRLNAVDEFIDDLIVTEEIKEMLKLIQDIERIMGRIIYATANARDFVMLKNSIKYFPHIKNYLSSFKSELNKSLHNQLDLLEDIFKLIDTAFVEEPPFSIREGNFLNDGYNIELDKYREAKTKGTTWLLDMETKEREATGIKALKIKYNKVFGYYIEITNSYRDQVPDRYVRRQTLSNCERYTTEGLKEIEEAILGADEKINDLEYTLFMEIRQQVSEQVARIQNSAYIISVIDVLASFSEVALRNNYVKPILTNDGVIDIKNGRHPVVEALSNNTFIDNDTYLNTAESRLSIITGPNMAGKSTYMRQTALIVLMAQIGCYVPASYASIGVVDRIFTRVGASDDLATGQSTFMVEMSEVANILNNATRSSLLILDEIGRGTSTFDGLSIAWSVLEYIANNIGAKTLFATHYHELTELEGQVEGVKNYCITVREQGEDIIFLRKIIRGGIDNSYGIQVARLAGVPIQVILRSREILSVLNDTDITKRKQKDNEPSEEVFYNTNKKNSLSSSQRIIINELKEIDIDTISPREALSTLYRLKSQV